MANAVRGVLAIVCFAFHITACNADALSDIRQRGTLRWGADRTGGGPFLYERNGETVGFEVELADYLARQMQVSPEFIQGQWDKLPSRLNRRDVDIILNGYEWTAEREQEWASTIPYYIYRLQLIGRRNDDTVKTWEDLRAAPGQPRKRVGVLSGTAAQRYLEDNFGDAIEIEAYGEGVTSAMQSVQFGKLAATVQDYPAAVYYVGNEFPGLHNVGAPVAPGYYVIFLRREDGALKQLLNQAIRQAIADGTLKRIYQKYGIWTAEQDTLAALADDWPPATPPPQLGGKELFRQGLLLLRAAWTTVVLSCVSMPLAMLIGLLVAIGRLYGPKWLGAILSIYVEILRGTPLLLQLFVIYFLLPVIDVKFLPFWAGVFGLAINYSAYEAENYRAGLLAIPRGQTEAALALGMSQWATLRHIIIPQAVKIVIPPVTNDFIALFKDTSICSAIAVTELTGKYNQLYNDHPSLVWQLGLITALLYLLMSYPLSLLARRLERKAPHVAA